MNLSDEMRAYVNSVVPGVESTVAGMSDATLRRSIDGYYPGGYEVWVANVRRDSLPADTSVKLGDVHQQGALRRRLFEVLGRKYPLGPAEITAVTLTDDLIILGLRIEHVSGNAFRDTVDRVTYRMVTFDRATTRRLSVIDADDATHTPTTTVSQYAKVNTPERHRERLTEYFECYRPGTDSHPMDGPDARDDLDLWNQCVNDGTFTIGEL